VRALSVAWGRVTVSLGYVQKLLEACTACPTKPTPSTPPPSEQANTTPIVFMGRGMTLRSLDDFATALERPAPPRHPMAGTGLLATSTFNQRGHPFRRQIFVPTDELDVSPALNHRVRFASIRPPVPFVLEMRPNALRGFVACHGYYSG